MEWKPIETAPKDAEHRLVSDGCITAIVYWSKKYGTWHGANGDGGYKYVDFTHWMPLPVLPNH